MAIYDATTSPYSYTGSGNIGTTDNQISLNSTLKVNDEIDLNPRNYDGAVFELISSTDMFCFLQNPIHGGAPIA